MVCGVENDRRVEPEEVEKVVWKICAKGLTGAGGYRGEWKSGLEYSSVSLIDIIILGSDSFFGWTES